MSHGPREGAGADLERYGQGTSVDGLRHDDALVLGRAAHVCIGGRGEFALAGQDVGSNGGGGRG